MTSHAFIVDVGSQNIKVGASTAAKPTMVPTICGTPRFPRALRPAAADALGLRSTTTTMRPRTCEDEDACLVGHEAMRERALLRLHAPVQRGTVHDWTATRALLAQANQLAVAQEGASVGDEMVLALVEHPFASRTQRQRLVEFYLEGGGGGGGGRAADGDSAESSPLHGRAFTGIFCGVAPLLALYATGATTGVALEVGHAVTSTAAAIAGRSLPAALQRQDGAVAGGDAVTHGLEQLLRQTGAFTSTTSTSPGRLVLGTGSAAERERLREIKEQVVCVAATPLPTTVPWTLPAESGGETVEAVAYTLPDGTTLAIDAVARLYASERLFCPSLIGSDARGLGTLLDDAVTSAGPEVACQLRQHVVLSGGTSLTPGFAPRCFHELQQRAGASESIRLVAPAERATTPWFGVSLLSQLSTFAANMVVTRDEYLENGESILHARLFT